MDVATESVSGVDSPPSSQHAVPNAAADYLIRTLDRLVDLSLAAVVFVVPFTMAGLKESGVALFVIASLTMSVAWAIRELLDPQSRSSMTLAPAILGAGVLLLLLQLTPLPTGVLHYLSPFTASHLPIWNESHFLFPEGTVWSRLSLTPALTKSGLMLLVGYSLFFLTLLQRIRTLGDIDRIFRWMSISVALMATLALGQMLFPNDLFLWMIEYPFRTSSWPAKGAFTNQNHFVHFLALGIGPLLLWWKSTVPRSASSPQSGFGGARKRVARPQFILGAMLALVFLAGVMSLSRAGVLALSVASLVSLLGIGVEKKRLLKLTVPSVIFIGSALLAFGSDSILSRIDTISEADSVSGISPGRFGLWSALMQGIPHFWIAGAGVGSHPDIYPTWLSQDFGVRFSHAESGYMHVLTETGVIGLSLVIAALLLTFSWAFGAWRRTKPGTDRRARVVVLVAGLLVTTFHSVVDFAWYIPACTIFAGLIAACLCRICQLTSARGAPRSSWPSGYAFFVVLAALPAAHLAADVVIPNANAETSWLNYRKQIIEAGRQDVYEKTEGLDQRLDGMITSLEESLRYNPSSFRAMSELATLYLRRFDHAQSKSDNPMSLREIKNTVETSEFAESREIMEWLQKAFGAHVIDLYRGLVTAERAIKGHPLRGESYLTLAQLGFLRGMPASEEHALVQQAVRLRPYKPPVLYFAGLVEAENGNLDEAFEWWKRAFHQSAAIRPLILQGIETTVSPEELVFRLEPDAAALCMIYSRFELQGLHEHKAWIAEYFSRNFARLLKDVQRPDRHFWRQSGLIFESLAEMEKAAECLSRSIQLYSGDIGLRKRYARILLTLNRNREAMSQLEWCILKTPNDRELQVLLSTARSPQLSEAGGGI